MQSEKDEIVAFTSNKIDDFRKRVSNCLIQSIHWKPVHIVALFVLKRGQCTIEPTVLKVGINVVCARLPAFLFFIPYGLPFILYWNHDADGTFRSIWGFLTNTKISRQSDTLALHSGASNFVQNSRSQAYNTKQLIKSAFSHHSLLLLLKLIPLTTLCPGENQ